jgi:hypothetical protein
MKKKIYTVLTVILLLRLFVPAAAVQAAEGITVTENSAGITFPSRIDFSLEAESNAVITDVRLHYNVERRGYVRVTSEVRVTIDPGTGITAGWSWDMRKAGGLPPGTVIYYWWSLKDVNGGNEVTEREMLKFEDTRFEWQAVSGGQVTLFWYEGDDDFAGELMSAATEGLARLRESTGVMLDGPVEIYIYGNSSDLQSALIFPQTWTGGVAYPQYGNIAIGIEPGNLDWGVRTIAHELTHLVVHQMTYNPYIDLPTWLDEGLAMYMEGPVTGVFTYYLNKAIENDSLISVRSLTSPFSAYADQSYLSYAESRSLVDMLIGRYGREKMLELLTVLSRGTGYDEALEAVYGFDMDGLDGIWRLYLEQTNGGQDAGGQTVARPVAAGSC